MGLYIKDMEIPTSCGKCKLFGASHAIGLFSTLGWCRVNGKEIFRLSEKADFCPLVEIPEPHGDLIDREGLQDIIGQLNLNWEYGQGVSDCWDALLDAPAIIPASEEVEI